MPPPIAISPPGSIRAIGVVIPVHNEEQLLGRCLSSIRIAIATVKNLRGRQPQIECALILDDCSDDSYEIATASGFEVHRVGSRNVGLARSTGVRAVLDTFSDIPVGRLWLAHTDADSAVPSNWLTHSLDLADDGADLVIGTVFPDPADLDAERRLAWQATHIPGRANGHVHGANLGVRGSVYLAAGGFAEASEHEDVNLVSAARLLTDRVRSTDAHSVLTSGRLHGRTDGGYARYLRDDLLPMAEATQAN